MMSLNGARVLVTGGAGFVPSHVVDQLVAERAIVTAIDDFSSGRRENLSHLPGVRVIAMDVCDPAISGIVKSQDVVIHMAANADVPKSVAMPDYDFENNVIGSYNVLRACLNSDVRKIVFASSAAVYGDPVYTPMDELHPTAPKSPYGAAKLAIEKLGMSYYESYGLPFTAIRIFNTYGPRQPRYVMFDLLRKLYRDPKHLEVLGTGEQIRDYSFVTDTARCFVLAAMSQETTGQVYNVAGGNPISIRELVGLLVQQLGLSQVDVTFTGQSWPGDIARLVADVSKTERVLGFHPSVGIREGIVQLETWLRSSHPKEVLA